MKKIKLKEIKQQILNIKEASSDNERKRLITEFQNWIWDSQVDVNNNILFEHLSDLAMDLEYYDPEEKKPPFYGVNVLKNELDEILSKINDIYAKKSSGIKNIILFIFGLLAVIFSSITVLWILYNFVSGNMHPVVKEKLDDNIFWSILYVIGVFSINLIIFSTGKRWISESGIVSALKK